MTIQTLTPSITSAPSRSRLRFALDRFGLPLVFVLLCVALGFSSEYFMTWRNWMDILRLTSISVVLVGGIAYVILTRGIDLSVGSILAFSGLCSAMVAVQGYGLLAALSAGMFAGAVMGALNGFMVANLSIPPFVATLGMLSVGRGLTFILNDGSPVTDLPEAYLALGTGKLGPAGLAGIVLSARTTSALPQAGVSYELDAIAAVVIGGTSLSGGTGSIVGTLFGALLIGVINNGLNLLGVSSYYQQVAKGLIIVFAVLIDVWRKRRA